MYGLYDTDGILRYLCHERDACVAYAELFNFPAVEYCLVDLDRTESSSGTPQNFSPSDSEDSSGKEQQLKPSLQIFP